MKHSIYRLLLLVLIVHPLNANQASSLSLAVGRTDSSSIPLGKNILGVLATSLATKVGMKTAPRPDIFVEPDSYSLVCPEPGSTLSKEQFKKFLTHTYHITIGQSHYAILQLYQYYQYDGFIELIREFSQYESFITQLHTQLRESKGAQLGCWWQGLSKSRICQLYKEIQAAKEQQMHKRQEMQKLASKKRDTEKTVRVQLQKEVDQLEGLYQEYLCQELVDGITTCQHERVERLGSFLSGDSQFVEQRHALSRSAQTMLFHHGLQFQEIQELKNTFIATQLQHSVYRECIDVINHLGSIKNSNHACNELETLALDMALLGCQASRAGYVKHAYSFADVGLAALECIKGMGEGIVDGVVATAQAALHPIETVNDMAQTVTTVGYYLGKALYEVSRFSVNICIDREKARTEWQDCYSTISSACTAFTEHIKATSARSLVRGVVSGITQTYLSGKCMGVAQKFFTSAASSAGKFVEQIKRGEQVAVTAEGITVQIAHEAGQTLSKMEQAGQRVKDTSRVVTKVHNMGEFFETGFGQGIKKFCKKTNYTYQNQTIYKIEEKIKNTIFDKGDYFYLDNLHKDHIEVFSKKGRIKAVLNLDGSMNVKKTNVASLEKRMLDI